MSAETSVEPDQTTPSSLSAARAAAGRPRWRRPILAALILCLLAGAGAWIVWMSPLLSVQTISVRGTTKVPPAQVKAAADVPLGTPLAAVDTQAVEARLRALPRAGKVEVRRGFPRELVLVVEERVPVAVVGSGGQWRTIDLDGLEVASVPTRPESLPRLTGSSRDGRTAALAVLATLPPSLAAQVDSISASTRDDVRLLLRSGDRVLWGDSSAGERKASVLAALLTRPGSIYDVSAPDLPTITE